MVYSDAGQIVTSDFHWTIGRPNAVRRNCTIPNQKALGSGIPKWWRTRSADEKYRNSAQKCASSRTHFLSHFLGIQEEVIEWIQSSSQIRCIIHCRITILYSHRTFADLRIPTVRTDHVCADNSYCDFRLHSLSGALFLYFSSADLVPHHFGMPEPRAFRFGMVQFLRTAFGLPIVQWKSLVTICPVSSVQIRRKPLGTSRPYLTLDLVQVYKAFSVSGRACGATLYQSINNSGSGSSILSVG